MGAKGVIVDLDALSDKELSQVLESVERLRWLTRPLQCQLKVLDVASVLQNGKFIHACEDHGVEDETVLQPVVLQIVLTDPIDSVLFDTFVILQTHLETLAISDALLQDCLAHYFLSYLPKSICVEVSLL